MPTAKVVAGLHTLRGPRISQRTFGTDCWLIRHGATTEGLCRGKQKEDMRQRQFGGLFGSFDCSIRYARSILEATEGLRQEKREPSSVFGVHCCGLCCVHEEAPLDKLVWSLGLQPLKTSEAAENTCKTAAFYHVEAGLSEIPLSKREIS